MVDSCFVFLILFVFLLRLFIFGDIFGVTPLLDVEVLELPGGVVAGSGWFGAGASALADINSTVSVVPGGDNEAHLALDVVGHIWEVVLAFSLHHDLSSLLGKGGSQLPECLVISGGDELGLDREWLVGVDEESIATVGTVTVLSLALDGHVVLALGSGVTFTVGARVGSSVEAGVVSLHDINASALRVLALGLTTFFAGADGVDAGNAATVDSGDVDVVGDGSASDVGFKIVIGTIVRFVLEDDGVVVGHADGVNINFAGRPVLWSEVFLD